MLVAREGLWLALLGLLAAGLPERAAALLEYRRDAILEGELWRLLSGHFVYFSARHALLDGCALVALVHALTGLGLPRVWPRLLLIALTLSAFLLLATPDMRTYRGASGLVMALAGVLLSALWRTRPGWRPGLVAISLLLIGKMLTDAMGVGADLAGLPEGVRVAWTAHAAGLALGVTLDRLSGRVAT